MTEKKMAIFREATRLFGEKGYDATPISEIAREAGVSEGTVFRHFKNKEDLLFQIFQRIRETFYEDLETKFRFEPEERGLDMVVRLLKIYCRFYEDRELEFDFIHRNNPYRMPGVGDPCRDEMQRIHDKMTEMLNIGVSMGVRDGSIRPIAVKECGLVMLGLLSGTVRLRLFQQDIHLKELENTLVTFALNALEAQPNGQAEKK